jgi:Cys-rich protein (TIGR01571 family)
MVERDLAINRDKQSKLTQSLQHVSDESESTKEIDASAVRVANETESTALASTLADMWKEMRMFDVPLYTEHIQDKIKALKQEETSLTAKLAALNKEGEQLNALDAGVHSRGSYFNFWSMSSAEKEAFFVGNLVYLLGALCVAFMFHKARDKYPKYFSAEARPDVIRSPTRFSFGICGCINAPNICVLGFCCPFMTWASTLDRHGMMPFFKAFLTMLLLALSSSYTYGMSAVILVALGVYYRQKIRMAYAIESNTQRTIFLDVLVWSFCQPCAIVQEAREAGVMLVDAP